MNLRLVVSRAFVLVSGLIASVLVTSCASGGPSPDVLVKREIFFVGGRYVGETGKEVMQGAMYVEHLSPPRSREKYPLVLIHGGGQTATNWMTTPDGRKGWAQYFVEQGFEVYMVDQPQRGRSAWHNGIDGALTSLPVSAAERLFTAPEQFRQWPQAKLHTQWPGTGRKGDPVFDQFYSSQVQYVASPAENQTAAAIAGVALIDRIGPAILIAHSQGSAVGWLMADARPQLVKGVVAIEPSGPPIQSSVAFGNRKQYAWGLTDVSMTYAPPVVQASELQVEQQVEADDVGLIPCWVQKQPARQLVNLRNIPQVIVTGEASHHAEYDHCVSRWLTQAGVSVESMRLERIGIHGNAHMMMIEKNNLDIAAAIVAWRKRAIP